jgi:hypothetical protein
MSKFRGDLYKGIIFFIFHSNLLDITSILYYT